MVKTIQVGERFITFSSAPDDKMVLKVSGHDAMGMYGAESITLDKAQALEAFEAFCAVMPGFVK